LKSRRNLITAVRKLANLSSKLFNELNCERRQQFFKHHVDFEVTWDRYYGKYKEELGVSAQAVMQKDNEARSSFFTLLKLRREGSLPPHIKHVAPPK